MKTTLRKELMISMMFLVILTNVVLGTFSYFAAKRELEESGKMVLKNGVHMIKEAIRLKHQEYLDGKITLKEAKEDIKVYILGTVNKKGFRQVKQEVNIGKNGYFFVLDTDSVAIAHPTQENKNISKLKDMSGKDVYVSKKLIDNALNGGGFLYYSWLYPDSEKIGPKIAYSEIDPSWNWVVSSSIYMEDFNKGANNMLFAMLSSLFITLSIGFIFVLAFSKSISRPIVQISTAMKRFVDGNFNTKVPDVKSNDEIGYLAKSFKYMSTKLSKEMKQRKHAEKQLKTLNSKLESKIKKRNTELQSSLTKLQEAQNILVESGKMASIGNLLSSISYEIQTPIENCLSASVQLKNHKDTLKEKIESNDLNQSDLSEFISKFETIENFIIENLNDTSNLICNFNKVAIDKQNLKPSYFNLYSQLMSIVNSAKRFYNKADFDIVVNCNQSISITSYPFSFYSIFMNLIENSMVHGFENRSTGLITIDVEVDDGLLKILYTDNGIGINSDIKSKIFDPFFTTKDFKEHSGLGLNIIYNLVVHKLKGNVYMDSDKEYTSFLIEIPSVDIVYNT